MAFSSPLYAQQVIPQLIELRLSGPSQGAYFTPSVIELDENETYLLVLENPYEIPYQFMAENFAEGIVTQYIQGSPAVTRGSVALSPNSKVQWIFRTIKGGEFPFYAESYGLQKTKVKPGVIKINPLIPINLETQNDSHVYDNLDEPLHEIHRKSIIRPDLKKR